MRVQHPTEHAAYTVHDSRRGCQYVGEPALSQISVNPPDGSPAAFVDDISLVYRPDLQLSETQCITSP